MILHNKQSEFIKSDARYKLLNWGRRSGKTTAVAYDIFLTLWNKDKSHVTYYAPSFSDARDIAWDIFRDVLKDITIKTNESLLEVVTKNRFGTTSKLTLKGWEAVKNRDKGRGTENDLVVLDECAFFPQFFEKFEKVIEPTLLTSKGGLIITSTPNGFNHFYDLTNTAIKDDEWFFSHCTSYDNPYNPKEELDKLKANKPIDAFKQEYLADFKKLEGLVYKEFERKRHTYKELPHNIDVRETLGAIDFGYTHPTAVLRVVYDSMGRYWVTNEWYKTEKTDEEIADYVATQDFNIVYPDPASPEAIKVLQQKRINTRDVVKGADSVQSGIQKVRELLKQRRLYVNVKCLNMLSEFEQYHYLENQPPGQEKPEKEFDHALDALRYLVMTHSPLKAIDNSKLRVKIHNRRNKAKVMV